jgi:hypothetical protein
LPSAGVSLASGNAGKARAPVALDEWTAIIDRMMNVDRILCEQSEIRSWMRV